MIALSKLNDEQLDCDLTVYDEKTDEYHAVRLDIIITNEDVLDTDHPVIGISNIE